MMHEFADQVRALADGPHSPERTVEVARTLEEAARVLVYATQTRSGGIGYASTVYDLVGALHPSVRSIEQVIEQATEWLKRRDREGVLTVDNGDRYAVYDVYEAARAAAVAAVQLAQTLEELHGSLSVIGGPVPSEGDA